MSLSRALRSFALIAFHVVIARPILYGLAGVRYRKKNLLPEGPCLVVANHNSHLDASVLLTMFPLKRLPHVHPVAAADYFGETLLRKTMAMLFMNAIGIERKPAPGTDALAPVVKALEDGESLIFFPEGSRGEPGVVATFRPGVGRLVKAKPGLVVVPVFMSGAERIWPRGEMVPLPLGIDINVGKPRTYSPELDAREIAEEIRNDVLALAPPPPPVPGPRPAGPVRVAVCGIDASSRRAVFEDLTARLGQIDRTVGIGTKIVEADGTGVREAKGRVKVARSRSWPRFLAWTFRTTGRWRGGKFAETVERARIEEGLEHGRSARFVVTSGGPLVDLMAWAEADFYRGVFDEKGLHRLQRYLSGERSLPFRQWGTYLSKAPTVWLLNVFDLARLSPPDFLVLLTMPPAEAMRRRTGSGKALEAYENEEFFGKLQEAYRAVAEVLRRGARVEVLQFDASALSPPEIAERVEHEVMRLLLRHGEKEAAS